MKKFEYTLDQFSRMKIDSDLQSKLRHIDYSTLSYIKKPTSIYCKYNLTNKLKERFNINHLFLSGIYDTSINGKNETIIIFLYNDCGIEIMDKKEFERDAKNLS